ncbi:Molybdenum cofactor synthesis protein 1 [Desmophyllum pertusum]|uniref:cyclic pyranopterin monophosphate synthase n=1 Tax=Desmophyllum pertusum TaxID=174260 RepID=A0A9W9YM90_9CNID|nr:Molybdenum cofactor synthesis protein 1 [Desmophyllum pertusum]
MVNVGAKKDSNRLAVATAMVYLGPEAFHLVKENKIRKGDVLTVAQLAGIMASKLTPNLIPLCHNIHITHAEVNLELDESKFAVRITGSVNCVGRTGVEMESLTAVTVAALTVYDMCKAVSRDIVISDIKLVKKTGGKSGDYVAS